MRVISLAGFVFGLLCFCVSVGAHAQEKFRLCSKAADIDGELYFLTRQSGDLCWKQLQGQAIRKSELAIHRQLHRFTYVFDEANRGEQFDPVFTVQTKRKAASKLSPLHEVQLVRDRMRTHCSNRDSKNTKAVEWSDLSETAPGAEFNRFSRGGKAVSSPAEIRFHVWFRNAKQQCVKTSDPVLRRYFAVDGDAFSSPRGFGLFTGSLAELFGVKPAKAMGSAYEQVTVRIGLGQFRAGSASASFGVRPTGEHDIVVKDLSTYLDDNSLRDTIKFSIAE